MAFPDPLQIEPARLILDGDRIVDADHGDWYFQYDGIDESHYVYLEGSGLLDRLQSHDDLVVGEVGFGTGLNFQLVCAAMAKVGYRGRLSYVGVEGRPLTAAQAEVANSLRPPALRWTPPGDQPRAGFVPVPMPATTCLPAASAPVGVPVVAPAAPNTTPDLLLLHGEASDALARLVAQVDLWFFDGFSPAKNPDAWTPALFEEVARLSRPGARFSTFTAASEIRHRLEAAGFRVAKRPGWGKKREHLVGVFKGEWTPRLAAGGRSLNIIGAGIAGQSLALAACAAGLPVNLHGTAMTLEGSAVPLALVNFRPSGDPGPLGHLRKAAFFAAQQSYGTFARGISESEAGTSAGPGTDTGTGAGTGAINPKASGVDLGHSRDQRQNRPLVRFGAESIVNDDRLRARWDRERDVTHRWISEDRVLVPGALCLDTAAFRQAVFASVACTPAALDGPDALANILSSAEPGALTIIAAGMGSLTLLDANSEPEAGLPSLVETLRPNRGQQDEIQLDTDENCTLRRPLNFGRLLLPQTGRDRAWLGASFDRDPPTDWSAPRDADTTDNLQRLARALPAMPAQSTGRTWVGLRATTPDHLPLAGLIGHSLGLLVGLGSKGFLYAPILSQCLIAEVLGRPLPLEGWVWRALNPGRFEDTPPPSAAGASRVNTFNSDAPANTA